MEDRHHQGAVGLYSWKSGGAWIQQTGDTAISEQPNLINTVSIYSSYGLPNKLLYNCTKLQMPFLYLEIEGVLYTARKYATSGNACSLIGYTQFLL